MYIAIDTQFKRLIKRLKPGIKIVMVKIKEDPSDNEKAYSYMHGYIHSFKMCSWIAIVS